MRKHILKLFSFSLGLIILLLSCEMSFAGEMIAFSRMSGDYWQIWVMNANGSNQHQVTFQSQDKRDPNWSIDGSKMIFHTTNGSLFVINADGTNQQEILGNFRNINYASWSKVKDEIIFVRFDPTMVDIGDIWKSDLKGEKPILLTRDAKLKYHPVFSPQGDKVAFAKTEDLKRHIWLMNADGSGVKELTSGDRIDVVPSFSPDGQNIIFASNQRKDENFEIYMTNLDGKNTKRLTNNSGLDTHPCFSPDGKKIVFVSNRNGSQQIWVMNQDGSNVAQLTYGNDESVDPAWVSIPDTKEPPR